MGIPKFFRWLTRRYPLILKNISREEDCPPIDNLYLDLNGIVHNCIHGNDAKLHERVSKLTDFDEVWANIMKAIDEIVHTVKPQGVLFLAVDGVAPRAKMNQQRARRFRSAKDSQMLNDKLIAEGKEAHALFDSNAISPGTKFMFELNRQLEFFVQYKLNTDHLYQKLEIVLSDSSVPGEGEHKMMDYIRQAKTQPGYDPNTRHCFYGADADLIMLSLLTHEPNFMIIREEHVVKKIKQGGVQRLDIQKTFNFQLIFISLLREYFQLEYSTLGPKMKMRFDLERVIDDFVFFCFFIGNDFLPSLSALDISEGSLDSLIDLYKQLLPSMTDYITESGKIYWDRAEPFINMLGKHELESFRMRIDSIRHARQERIVSFQADFGGASGEVDQATLIKNKIRDKLNEKKVLKIFQLKTKNRDKTYKKFLLMKRFDEDEAEEGLSKRQKDIKAKMIEKYRLVRDSIPGIASGEDAKEGSSEEKKKEETLRDIIEGIKEEYFSDLNIRDINDEEVSDVDESEINLDNVPLSEQNPSLSNKIKVQEEIIDKYSEANLIFMTEFIQMFAQDPVKAKAYYYDQKLKVDVFSESGVQFKKRMLKKYLEGLQWVLYYYYRGAQHWRWYYPYHYAPMISDIDEGIVQFFLKGKVTIEEFDIDSNCSDINVPYTPFQQLLSIMPTKSIGLLPEGYATIANGELIEYFPADFDIDLNGRALPWEASCLIPFIDEGLFIEKEKEMLSGFSLNDDDKKRNQVYFYFKKFIYDIKAKKENKGTFLQSTIKKIRNIENSFATTQLLYDYQDVGKHSFLPELLPGLILPCRDFPSFHWLGVNQVDYDEKIINKVPFQRVLIKIPSCLEDRSSEDLEGFVNKFVKQINKELYLGLPYQIEAFPVTFEDERFTYTLYGDVYTNIYKIHKDDQQMDQSQFGQFQRRQQYKLQDNGFSIQDAKCFVSLNRLKEVRFDSKNHVFYKIYEEQSELLPLSFVMRKRDPSHYLNMNLRCNSMMQSFKPESQALCLNMQLFGVMGKINAIDMQKQQVKVEFDKEREEAKIHDPFFGQRVLSDQDLHNAINAKRYYSDSQIEQMLHFQRGIINKLTGSFLLTFNDREKLERQVVDLGLNIKNWTKKVHIPDYVRYVSDPDSLADNQYDTYNHNQHSRGARHIRKHWEYSEECFQMLKEYKEKFGEILDCIQRGMRINKQVLTMKDLFGPKVDEAKMVHKIREVTTWIEKSPLSKLPYVEMGFDALHEDLIVKIDLKKQQIVDQYQPIKLKCRQYEFLQPNFIYQECYPYWCQPFSDRQSDDFRVGDRVININSSRREYVPFGLRGTVVGHTTDKVIVLFDEQYLGGNNIHGHTEEFKGGYINPNFLINLTHKFTQIFKKNMELVQSFQEQPAEGTPEAEALEIQRQALIMSIENSAQGQYHQQPGQHQQQQQYQEQPQRVQQPRGQYRQQNNRQEGGAAAQQTQAAPQRYGKNYNDKQAPQQKQAQQLPVVPKEEEKKTSGGHQKQVYVVKQSISVEQTVVTNNVLPEDEGEEVYQDLKSLLTSLQSSLPPLEARATSVQADPVALLNPNAAGFVPSFTLGATQSAPIAPSGEFIPSFNLQTNPDFQQLMDLMNVVATNPALQAQVYPGMNNNGGHNQQ